MLKIIYTAISHFENHRIFALDIGITLKHNGAIIGRIPITVTRSKDIINVPNFPVFKKILDNKAIKFQNSDTYNRLIGKSAIDKFFSYAYTLKTVLSPEMIPYSTTNNITIQLLKEDTSQKLKFLAALITESIKYDHHNIDLTPKYVKVNLNYDNLLTGKLYINRNNINDIELITSQFNIDNLHLIEIEI
ncbi:MAG: hypothetical protein QXV17_10055 [Candidatus Micrarchaeaceae archaeon]